jgi:putative ATP-dependent endonuclease of OLD family
LKLREVGIQNFRNLVDINIPIEDTTILVGENNSGKTALLDALKIALPSSSASRRTAFDEYDYHMSKTHDSPQTCKGIVIELWFREDSPNEWPESLVQDLNEIVQTEPIEDLDSIGLRVSCKYDTIIKDFIPKWEFLALDGQPLEGKGANPNNLTRFLSYIRLFYLSSLRDSNDEFSPRSQYWGRILRNLKISDDQRKILSEELAKLNESLLRADSRLEQLKECLGKVQKIMALGTGQNTSIQALPLKPWELMSKSEVVIKADGSEIDFPLSCYGQGMQSLSVLFLFQAYIDLLLKPTFKPETEAILTLEEPEAHLHPQATMALAKNLGEIRSQKIVSSHSPYFIQEIPFTCLRIFRRNGPLSKVLYIKRFFTAKIPETPELVRFCEGMSPRFEYCKRSSILAVRGCIEKDDYKRLFLMYPNQEEVQERLKRLNNESQLYLSDAEIVKLETFAKRIRGEVLFARSWLLCEGQSEYLLIRYFADLLDKPLDQKGITVIDYQNNGSPSIFVALARTFEIPWIMVSDNDAAGKGYAEEVRKRGLTEGEMRELVRPLPLENADLEMFLVKNGFAQEYIQILTERGISLDKRPGEAGFEDEIVSTIRRDKIGYTHALIEKLRDVNVKKDRVPLFFENAINDVIA